MENVEQFVDTVIILTVFNINKHNSKQDCHA